MRGGRGAPADRVTLLEGLTYSPPLHETRLSGMAGGLSFERANKYNKQDGG